MKEFRTTVIGKMVSKANSRRITRTGLVIKSQDAWFTNYMKSRYGTWVNAKAFWLSHNWW